MIVAVFALLAAVSCGSLYILGRAFGLAMAENRRLVAALLAARGEPAAARALADPPPRRQADEDRAPPVDIIGL